MMPFLKAPRRSFVIVAAVALVFRMAFLIWQVSGWHAAPTKTVDRSYMSQGYAIAAGYGYPEFFANADARLALSKLSGLVNHEGVQLTPEFARANPIRGLAPGTLHPPGLPLLVAGIHRLSGGPAELPIQVIGALLDVFTSCLLLWIAAAALGPRIGLAAALCYALFPPAAYASVEKSPTVFLTSLIVVSLACVIQAARRTGLPSLHWMMAAGVALGVGSYFRSDYMALPVFYGLAMWAFSRRFGRSFASFAVMQGLVFVLLLPLGYRNHRATGQWIFTSTAAGAVMIHGLGMFDNPWGFGMDDSDRVREAAAQGIEGLSSPEANAYFKQVFVKSVLEHPGGFVMSVVKRLPAAFATPYDFGFENQWRTQSFTQAREAGMDRYQVMRERPLYVLAAYGPRMVMAGLSFLGFLCCVFMLWVERRHAGLILLLLAPHLYSLSAHLPLTHMQPYYVMPSAFCWLFGLGYVLSWPWRRDGSEAAQRLQPADGALSA